MIAWYSITTIALSLVFAVTALLVFARKKAPNDLTVIPALITTLLLFIQIIITIFAPFVGNPPVGDLLEIWLYLVTAFALPIGAFIWALTDKTKWANLILAVVQASIAVMSWRMLILWLG